MSGGQLITISQGVLTAQSDNNVSTSLTGIGITLSAGTLSPASTRALDGQALAIGQGNLSGVGELDDLYIQAFAGTMVAGVSVTLTGQLIVSSQGAFFQAGAITLTLSEAGLGTATVSDSGIGSADVSDALPS